MAQEGLAILKKHMLVYLAGEERVGKTLAAILIAKNINVKHILVLTKKKAIDGWIKTLKQYEHDRFYRVTNYHQIHKLKPRYDLIIFDEAHNYISKFPQPSKMWHKAKELADSKPIILLSATPDAQGYHLLYHQFALSSWSPWKKWKTGMEWFNEFGIPKTIWIGQRPQSVYTEIQERCMDYVKHLFVTQTRQEAGFKYEPVDKLHYIELDETTKEVYNYLTRHKAIELNGEDLICDTVTKLRTSLHMLEGGVTIFLDKNKKRKYVVLGNTEKIDYIKQQWGDTENIVIMYYYIAEGKKLKQYFKKAKILQSTTYAEGVDLSMYSDLIIYSQDFSTARFVQRRARQININNQRELTIHFLIVKGAISEKVYKTVSINKKNYIDALYEDSYI